MNVEADLADDSLKLLARAIGDDDRTRLEAFLRVGSEQLTRRWRLLADPQGQADAMLLGPGEDAPAATMPLLRLVDRGVAATRPGQLAQPLAFEPLMTELVRIEQQLRAAPNDAASQPIDLPLEPVHYEPTQPITIPMHLETRPPVPRLRPGVLYRLERLPSAAKLGGDRHLSTIASLLTLGAVRLEELVAQSGMDLPTCESCLVQLQSLGMLTVIEPSQAPRRRGSAPPPKVEADSDASVLARLRERLGLGNR